MSLEEAKMLGASKEERDAIFKATQNKEISPVRLMFIKNKEPVPLVDNNGELVIDKNTKNLNTSSLLSLKMVKRCSNLLTETLNPKCNSSLFIM
ncbi:PZ5b [Helicobacter pylori Hp H-10]|nr:PZ5b [Helicobacter pylori Hp H-10]